MNRKGSLNVSNLSDDVVCAIFDACAALDPPHRRYEGEEFETHLGWIFLGHVNRRWRALLLGLSPLWGEIVYEFPEAAEEMLARARGVPLDFVVPYVQGEEFERRLVQLVSRNIAQIRRLRIGSYEASGLQNWIGAKYRHEFSEMLTSQPLPLLQEVSLRFADWFGTIFERHYLEFTGSIDPSLRLAAPSLRTYGYPDLFTFACPTLTSLDTTLYGVNIESSKQHLVDMLRGFPLLETMRLHLKYGDHRPSSRGRRRPVPPTPTPRKIEWRYIISEQVVLDHLKTSVIAGVEQANVVGLWSCIEAPARTNVRLVGVDLGKSIVPACHVVRRQLQDTALDTLLVKFLGNPTLEVSLRSSREQRGTAGKHEVALSTGVCPTESSQAPMVVACLVSALQVQAIRRLSLSAKNDRQYFYDNEEMRRTLRPLSSVVTTSIHGAGGVGGVIRMMDVPEDGSSLLFPQLSTLVVHMRMIFGEFEGWHADCWEALTEVLDRRKRAGAPVRELYIRGGWASERVKEVCVEVEAMQLSKVQAVVEVVRDERTVKAYQTEYGDYDYTDSESEPDEDEQ